MRLILLLLLLISSNAFALTWDKSFNSADRISITTTTNPNDTLTSTSGSVGIYDNMVGTQENIAFGDGYIEGEITTGGGLHFCLSNTPTLATGTVNQTSVFEACDFGIFQNGTDLRWVQGANSSIFVAAGVLTIGAVVRIAVVGADIVVTIDGGAPVYTVSAPTINYPLHAIWFPRQSSVSLSNIDIFQAGFPPGTFNAFTPASPSTKSVSLKGGLLTSDGSKQIQVPACADTEALGYDSSTESGFICVTN